MNFARRATAPAMFSVALMDPVCPPSTVFAAYNHYSSLAGTPAPTTIDVYPFNEHEGGQGHQFTKQLPWLRSLAGLTPAGPPSSAASLTPAGALS